MLHKTEFLLRSYRIFPDRFHYAKISGLLGTSTNQKIETVAYPFVRTNLTTSKAQLAPAVRLEHHYYSKLLSHVKYLLVSKVETHPCHLFHFTLKLFVSISIYIIALQYDFLSVSLWSPVSKILPMEKRLSGVPSPVIRYYPIKLDFSTI